MPIVIPGQQRTRQKGITIPGGAKQTGIIIGGKPDLATTEGLEQFAQQAGLEQKAQRALATKGEDPREIFSGGFITDIFDALNALQYGVVGMLKGKGFSEGVRTRQSFSDKDALGDNGLPGVIGGIAMDIAVDPLTYIAPWTILKKVGAAKPLIKAAKAGEQTKAGQWLGRKMVYMHGVDPVFRETYERSVKNIAVAGQNLNEMVKPLADLTPDIAKKLLRRDKTGRFIRKPLEELRGELTDDQLFNASKAYSVLDALGRQAVDLNLLGKKTFEENIGEYIKTAFTEFEQARRKGVFGFAKVGIKGIKKRKPGMTPERLAELGQIDNPAYLLFKSTFDLARDVENAKLFRQVAQRFGSDEALEGFVQMSKKSGRVGELAGKWVPQNIADYINEITRPIEPGLGKKLVAGFKFSKVIMNPATHARNVTSNQILNWWKLGMNPLDPRTADVWQLAGRAMKKGSGRYIDEARSVGYNLNTMASNEITSLLTGPDAVQAFGKARGLFSKSVNKISSIYQSEENFSKLAAFIYNRKYKGMGIEDAWKLAESATFNYAQVTPFVRMLRESLLGFPFVTFTYKATPLAIETALKAPRRISAFGKIKQALENQADIEVTERERASEPAWVRDGFYIKLPTQDKHGRSAYFDLTYIIPFGDIVSGQFFTRQVSRETGLKEPAVETALEKFPALNIIKELARNQDFFGDRIFKESDSVDKQLGDISLYLTRQYAPPLVGSELPGGYMRDGERRQKGFLGIPDKGERIKQQRTLMQELLRNVGAKIQPIDVDIQETWAEWEKRKALETILREEQAVEEFRKLYVPK